MKNILFVASESVPFIKTGGLADVVGALPKHLDKNQFDVRVIIPNYTCIPWELRSQFRYIHHFYINMGLGMPAAHVGIMTMQYDGITYYFIDNEHYFSGNKPYGDIRFDIEKFAFFSKAALSILPTINFHPDIIHCHDWQTGLVPVYLKTVFADNPFYWNIKTIMTIHNLKFQGIYDRQTFQRVTGLPDEVFVPFYGVEYKGEGNMLKGGLVYADHITTVSNSYAWEIQLPYYGEGLDGLLRERHGALWGVVNGIDYGIFNPATDWHLAYNYHADNFRWDKIHNKRHLQHQLGLPVDDNKFVIAIVSRLTDQKGLDLINWAMEGICDNNTQLVVLGTGDERYENMFRHFQWVKPGKVSANIYYSEDLAQKIYAGADAILMPSNFEPCGLTQLIALRYGTVPIVRETGGLRDTVEPYNEFELRGTGFTFSNYNAQEMLDTINFARRTYFDYRDNWNNIVERGMRQDFSWWRSAGIYADLYNRLTWW